MNIINNSFSIVINGDWNKEFIRPSWIAEKVFEIDQINLEVIGKELDYTVQVRNNNIIIRPNQNRVVIICEDISDESIREFEKVFINFINECISPMIASYGFNIGFEEDETKNYSSVVDNLKDNEILLENDIIIENTDIIRKIMYKDMPFTLKYIINKNKLNMIFNSHFDWNDESNKILIEEGYISKFVNSCIVILGLYGYHLEEED